VVNSEKKLLETKDIGKEFNGVWVLKNINFELKKGEVHSIVGENGAGKSTFIKILSGVYPPSKGKVMLDGETIYFNNVKDSEKVGIRTVHQEINLIPFFTILENIFIGNELEKRIAGVSIINHKKMVEKALDVFRTLNVEIDLKKYGHQINTAMQKIVQICSALVYNPKIIIFDEPTTALGEKERISVMEVIKELKKTGMGIIFVSHNLDEVMELSDKITVFRNGEKIDTILRKEANVEDVVNMMIGHKSFSVYKRTKNRKNERVKLEVKNLHTAKLHNINFKVYEGEVLGIAGITGAGKTEIANALYGIDPILSGEILLDNKPFKPKNPTNSVRNGIVHIPEDRRSKGLILNMAIRKNVTLTFLDKYANLGVINEEREKKDTDNLIKYLNIKCNGREQIVKFLSGGNQQKTILARCLAGEFMVGIFDESTNGIDIKAKETIYKLVDELTLRGKTIIFLSSYLPELINIADRIIVIKNGQLVRTFDPEKSSESEIMVAMLGGE